MIVYIETTIRRTFGEIPEDPEWFDCKHADAKLIGRFNETIKTYDKFTCMYPCDADREVLRRRQKLVELYKNKTVRFGVKTIQFEDYDFEMAKLRNFERRMA